MIEIIICLIIGCLTFTLILGAFIFEWIERKNFAERTAPLIKENLKFNALLIINGIK